MCLTQVAPICCGRGFPSPVMGSLQSATPPTCVAQQATREDKTLSERLLSEASRWKGLHTRRRGFLSRLAMQFAYADPQDVGAT